MELMFFGSKVGNHSDFILHHGVFAGCGKIIFEEHAGCPVFLVYMCLPGCFKLAFRESPPEGRHCNRDKDYIRIACDPYYLQLSSTFALILMYGPENYW